MGQSRDTESLLLPTPFTYWSQEAARPSTWPWLRVRQTSEQWGTVSQWNSQGRAGRARCLECGAQLHTRAWGVLTSAAEGPAEALAGPRFRT